MSQRPNREIASDRIRRVRTHQLFNDDPVLEGASYVLSPFLDAKPSRGTRWRLFHAGPDPVPGGWPAQLASVIYVKEEPLKIALSYQRVLLRRHTFTIKRKAAHALQS